MNNNIKELIRKNIRELKAYSSARDEYSGAEGVFLDANENPYGNFNRYPDPHQQDLKKLISSIKNIPTENIFLGNGSDEVIDLAFRIFCEPGLDKALCFSPTYGMYEVAAQINNVELIKIPLNEKFQVEQDLLTPYFEDKSLKLIIICSPNNPTGNLIKALTIENILKDFQGIVLIDEAYIDFCETASFTKRLNEFPNLIICQTLSKAWAMASLRVGMAFMSEELTEVFNRVKPPYNISKVNQEQALQTLSDKAKYKENIGKISIQKEVLLRELNNLKFVLKIYPTDANFLLVQVKDADDLYNYLIKNGVVIRNRNSVIENCLRITIGTEAENNILLNCLKSYNNE